MKRLLVLARLQADGVSVFSKERLAVLAEPCVEGCVANVLLSVLLENIV